MWTRERLIEHLARGGRVDYLFFWGHTPKDPRRVDGASNLDARVPSRWRGLNLLGFALMEARARLFPEGTL
jgi:hypothetical protein